jgi:outer membrane receptor protein involved in Fe transport
VATSNNETINVNHMDGATYFDANIQYKFMSGPSGEASAYLNIRNLMNKDPFIQAQGPAGVTFLTPAFNPSLYDSIGRTFRAGVRFKM